MASIPCTIHNHISLSSSCARSSQVLRSPFLAFTKRVGWRRDSRLMKRADLAGGGGGARGARCWFKFGNRGVDAEGAGIYGSQYQDDFDRDDVEQVFTGIFAAGIYVIFLFETAESTRTTGQCEMSRYALACCEMFPTGFCRNALKRSFNNFL
ncbi:protein LHCP TRANSLOCATION DEFECT-like [Dendrobium catenatum]|uniref:protein LHCP TRANSLOCATION DEFECT-like n=1 Tax=Dendrobium catenatum TaxID=906689 RepID=UPI0009F3782F|nr:protein LHCP TRANSLOCATION DEFECT-like [Dendrobium catenatum]